ncbi:hypothetical protein [Oleiharenicola sp. Vm1]|uniref:hypothetical protein n=1 Tax=Oleiharenicola sp. Vm1 TaxID=3398393 RepID=UPI0039F58269
MKTPAFLHTVRGSLCLLACASTLGLPSLTAAEKEPALENYIDLAAGYNLQSGDRAGFQQRTQVHKDGFGGIESLYYTQDLAEGLTFKLRGRAIAGNNDYLLDLSLTKQDVGYLLFGYKSFRTYYDGSGGVWPTNGFRLSLYNEDLYVDRSNLWFEAGLTKPDLPSFVLRYDYITRDGMKDSTSWGDTGLAVSAAATRNISPTYLKFDEKRHIVKGTIAKTGEKNAWTIAYRVDKGDYTNGRYTVRRPFESTTQRYTTNKEGQDFDMNQIRGTFSSDITEFIKLNTAVARTKYDTVLSASRITGGSFDSAFSATAPNRQWHDEGFYALPGMNLGESEMTQSIATISLLYTPIENLVVTPAFRFEKTTWNNRIEFEETNVGNAPSFVTAIEELQADSEKSWKTYTYGAEARYTGIANVSLNLKGEVSTSDGTLAETSIAEPGTPAESIAIDRDTELKRDTQKIAATMNWYPRAGHTVAVQYYYKARQNDYDAIRDTTPNSITSSDRYPAYIANQDFETNDFNIRYSWRVLPNLRSVTRYDYAKTIIRSQEVGLAFGETMNNEQSILAESVTWNPLPRWFLTGSVNYVQDKLHTPANDATGAIAGILPESKANYTTWNLSSGYVLDDQTDLFVDYMSYRTRDSYVNNSTLTVPFGSDNKYQVASATLVRRIDRRTTLSLKYSYAKNEDVVSLGAADFTAHLIYAKLQYRF